MADASQSTAPTIGTGSSSAWTRCACTRRHWFPARACQRATVRSSRPNAAAIAWVRQPYASRVATTATSSRAVRSRCSAVPASRRTSPTPLTLMAPPCPGVDHHVPLARPTVGTLRPIPTEQNWCCGSISPGLSMIFDTHRACLRTRFPCTHLILGQRGCYPIRSRVPTRRVMLATRKSAGRSSAKHTDAGTGRGTG